MVSVSLAKPATVNSFVVYAVSAAAYIALNVGIHYATGNPSHGLAIFVKSKEYRKHPLYLNGRLIFIVLSQLSAACAFSLRNITLDRFVFGWERKSAKRRFSLGDIIQSIVVAALVATLALPMATLVFALFRVTLPLVYKLPLVHTVLRPFTAHFLRGTWTLLLPLYHIPLLARAWFLAFSTLSIWEFSNATFDTFIYNPLSVIDATPDTHVTLVSGISSSDLGFRYLAYQDIRRLATTDSESAANHRSALFSEQKYNPNVWSQLARESLLFLGNDYQHLLRRGKPPPPKPTSPVAPATPARPSLAVPPTPLIRTSVFQSSKHSSSPIRNVVESLGSDGPLAQALDAQTEAARIPELFRSVSVKTPGPSAAPPTPAPAKAEVKKEEKKQESVVDRYVKEAKQKVHEVVMRSLPSWAHTFVLDFDAWWRKERLDKIAQSCLPNVELDVVIVDVLSHLICASLAEDKYGVVQRDIPKILEAMLSYLSALQAYQTEVRAKYTPLDQNKEYTPGQLKESEEMRAEVDKALDVLNYLSEDLRVGIARIVRTFGDKLLAFKFPPRTAERLQPFLEYC
ncbi:hypothetical protein H0H92_009749 [Tricholoma furcatifolium]|nr:hypothetical protein H0H92_009749 [Tricholoma furcatifolium]